MGIFTANNIGNTANLGMFTANIIFNTANMVFNTASVKNQKLLKIVYLLNKDHIIIIYIIIVYFKKIYGNDIILVKMYFSMNIFLLQIFSTAQIQYQYTIGYIGLS